MLSQYNGHLIAGKFRVILSLNIEVTSNVDFITGGLDLVKKSCLSCA